MKICSRLIRLSRGVEENVFMTFVDIKQFSGQLLACDDRHYVFKGYKIMNRLILCFYYILDISLKWYKKFIYWATKLAKTCQVFHNSYLSFGNLDRF